ncbi:MAG: hypothetical protein ACUVTW_08145, partial [Thermogutta sp.]
MRLLIFISAVILPATVAAQEHVLILRDTGSLQLARDSEKGAAESPPETWVLFEDDPLPRDESPSAEVQLAEMDTPHLQTTNHSKPVAGPDRQIKLTAIDESAPLPQPTPAKANEPTPAQTAEARVPASAPRDSIGPFEIIEESGELTVIVRRS